MSRRAARELAFQVLFQVDVGRASPSEALQRSLAEEPMDEGAAAFARTLVLGVVEHLEEIDSYIRRFAVDWQLDRLASVDRSLLRLALYEMLYLPDIPKNVSINEAVELSKIFNTEESSRFVNGLLDRARREIEAIKNNGGTNLPEDQ